MDRSIRPAVTIGSVTAEPLGPPTGVDERALRETSSGRDEPDWLVAQRVDALRSLPEHSLPSWWQSESVGTVDLVGVPAGVSRRWGADLPQIVDPASPSGPAGAAAQEDAELAFYSQLEQLSQRGVVFCDLATAVAVHPELVRPHLGKQIPGKEDWAGALAVALWSGGTFLYVPAGVAIDRPLQSYARVRSESPDQFERTLIVVEEGAAIHYLEGCASPVYSTDRVRGAVVEIVVGSSAQVAYTTVQNWSSNVTEVTRTAATVHSRGRLNWTAGNIGARRSERRLTCHLSGDGAIGVARTVSYAGAGQVQKTDVEMIHAATRTHAETISRSVADTDGRVNHNDRITADGFPTESDSRVDGECLALADKASVNHTAAEDVRSVDHPGSDPKIGAGESAVIDEDKRFYLMSRGLSRQQATALLVNGFINPVIETLPTEYAVEWARLIELQIEGAIG